MSEASKMPRYTVQNDGVGPYAIFYCDRCSREYRSQPEVAKTLANDLGRDVMGGFLRKNSPGGQRGCRECGWAGPPVCLQFDACPGGERLEPGKGSLQGMPYLLPGCMRVRF